MSPTASTLPIGTASSPLQPGQTVVHRLFNRDELACARTGIVVGHDERGLRLWYTAGNPGLGRCAADGRHIRDMPFAEWVRQEYTTAPIQWLGRDILMLVRPGLAHSVWWFYEPDGTFANWYINLEEPAVVWHDGEVAGVDTVDQDLDVVAAPDGGWAWKDEDEFAERLEFAEHYWVADEAGVRAEGQRAIGTFVAREFPFDGTWCNWRPDPAWRLPTALPASATLPRIHYGQ